MMMHTNSLLWDLVPVFPLDELDLKYNFALLKFILIVHRPHISPPYYRQFLNVTVAIMQIIRTTVATDPTDYVAATVHLLCYFFMFDHVYAMINWWRVRLVKEVGFASWADVTGGDQVAEFGQVRTTFFTAVDVIALVVFLEFARHFCYNDLI